jgi:hypothetical protein
MSKKTATPIEAPQDTYDFPPDEADSSTLESIDFNVNDEYKASPLIPVSKGYHAVCTDVSFDGSKHALVWNLCLHDNGGMLNDQETPLDGAHVYFYNWLPKAGEENIPTKSGRSSKRQAKINMLKDFQTATDIDMSTPQIIATALSEGAWIGAEFDVDISVREWQGKFSNEVTRIYRSTI